MEQGGRNLNTNTVGKLHRKSTLDGTLHNTFKVFTQRDSSFTFTCKPQQPTD